MAGPPEMDNIPLPVSVIIPTHNRKDQLRRTLDALGRQSFPMDSMEVIVVADGCTDGTLGMLNAYPAPYALKMLSLPGNGPGAARNAGASLAGGKILIFLDDDVEASPGLVAAHFQGGAAEKEDVTIGYLPPVLKNQAGLFRPELYGWWEAMFSRLRHPGHRFAYNDLLSGNFSLPASVFDRLGGFNPDLRCHEDYEFGYRLIQANIPFVYSEEALGYHMEATDLAGSLKRKTAEGIADVQLIELHPELLPVLPLLVLDRYVLWPSRLMQLLAFHWPAGGNILAGLAKRLLALFDSLKLRSPWLRILDGLMAYHYWLGVAGSLGSLGELHRRLRVDPAEAYGLGRFIELNLKDGIVQAEQRLDEERPAAVRVRYGKTFAGWLPPMAGAEPWRGAHLRPALSSGLKIPLLKALVREGAIEDRDLSLRLSALLEAFS